MRIVFTRVTTQGTDRAIHVRVVGVWYVHTRLAVESSPAGAGVVSCSFC